MSPSRSTPTHTVGYVGVCDQVAFKVIREFFIYFMPAIFLRILGYTR